DLAVLHRQRRTGLERRAHAAFLALEAIGDVVAHQLLRLVLHGLAAPFGAGADVLLLHVLLHLVAGVAAGRRAADRGQRLAFAAADGAAEQSARDSADRGAGEAVLVLHRRLVLHLHVIALLARRDDDLVD